MVVSLKITSVKITAVKITYSLKVTSLQSTLLSITPRHLVSLVSTLQIIPTHTSHEYSLYGCYSDTRIHKAMHLSLQAPKLPVSPCNRSSWWRDVFVTLVLNDLVVGEAFICRWLQNVAKIQSELCVLKIGGSQYTVFFNFYFALIELSAAMKMRTG